MGIVLILSLPYLWSVLLTKPSHVPSTYASPPWGVASLNKKLIMNYEQKLIKLKFEAFRITNDIQIAFGQSFGTMTVNDSSWVVVVDLLVPEILAKFPKRGLKINCIWRSLLILWWRISHEWACFLLVHKLGDQYPQWHRKFKQIWGDLGLGCRSFKN